MRLDVEKRESGLEGFRRGEIQEKRDTGKEGFRKQGRRDAGQKGSRAAGMKNEDFRSNDARKEGCRRKISVERMQDRRDVLYDSWDAGLEGWRWKI